MPSAKAFSTTLWCGLFSVTAVFTVDAQQSSRPGTTQVIEGATRIQVPTTPEERAIKAIFNNPESDDSITLLDNGEVKPGESNAKTQQVIRNVMSPYCPGLSLESCPSPDAHVLRGEIRKAMSHGLTEEEVRSKLVDKYGRDVLGIPPDDKFGTITWAMPFVVLLAAGTGITIWLRRKVKDTRGSDSHLDGPQSPDDGDYDAELLNKLKEEMRRG